MEVWFEGGGQKSESFTYQMVSDTDNRMLVVAAEDYSGASPVQAPGPHYAQTYVAALAANGIAADVYDVDARGRTAPDQLGVLSHYKGVIWESGDDAVTRTAGRGPGNADRLALDEMLEMRAYMDEGGRVLYTGKQAGQQYTGAAVGTQFYDPKGEAACRPVDPAMDPRRCLVLRGSTQGGDPINDVLQYWFGGMVQIAGDGQTGNTPFPINGIGSPFDGLAQWSLTAPAAANTTSSFVTTSGVLPADEYPQFESRASSRWAKPGGPFDPRTGSRYVYSQIADVTYKRLTREIAVPAGGGDLTFWTSYDTEPDWDFLAVEARTAGGNDWTTLPDANGHTSQNTGQSCLAGNSGGWRTLHPHLDHYQTQSGRDVHAHRQHRRRVERRIGELERLAAVVDRPRPVGRPDGRDLDRLHQRLGHAEPRRVPGRLRVAGWRRPRSRAPTPAAGRSPVRRRAAAPTRTTSRSPTPVVSRLVRRSRPRSRCCSATGSRPSPPRISARR